MFFSENHLIFTLHSNLFVYRNDMVLLWHRLTNFVFYAILFYSFTMAKKLKYNYLYLYHVQYIELLIYK
jgi:hypothetical protein